MEKFTVKMVNTTTNASVVLLKDATKEMAEKIAEEFKQNCPTDELKVVVKRQLNQHEKTVRRLIQNAVSEWIGGYENTLQDYRPGDEEYEYAKNVVLNHDFLFDTIYHDVMVESKGNYASHIRFAGKKFIEEEIERKLEKCGYGKNS